MESEATDAWAFRQVGGEEGITVVEPYTVIPNFPVKLLAHTPGSDLVVAAGSNDFVVSKVSEVLNALSTNCEPSLSRHAHSGILLVEMLANGTQIFVYDSGSCLTLYSLPTLTSEWSRIIPGIKGLVAHPSEADVAYTTSEGSWSLSTGEKLSGPGAFAWKADGSPTCNAKALYITCFGTKQLSVVDDEDINFEGVAIDDACPPFGDDTRCFAWYSAQIPHQGGTRSVPALLVSTAARSTDFLLLQEESVLEIEDDGARPFLPMLADGADASPVGFAIDFSTTTPTPSPFPGVDEGPPAPIALLLTNAGTLVAWNVVNRYATSQPSVPSLISQKLDPQMPGSNEKASDTSASVDVVKDNLEDEPEELKVSDQISATESPFAINGKPFGSSSWGSAGSAFGKGPAVSMQSTFGQVPNVPKEQPVSVRSDNNSESSSSIVTHQSARPSFGKSLFGTSSQVLASKENSSAPSPFALMASGEKKSVFESSSSKSAFGTDTGERDSSSRSLNPVSPVELAAPAARKSIFSGAASSSSPFSGSSNINQGNPSIFGNKSAPTEDKPLIFGGNSTHTQEKPSVFANTSTKGKPSVFGNQSTQERPSIFGSAPSISNKDSKGGDMSISGKSPLFGTGGGQKTSVFGERKATSTAGTFPAKGGSVTSSERGIGDLNLSLSTSKPAGSGSPFDHLRKNVATEKNSTKLAAGDKDPAGGLSLGSLTMSDANKSDQNPDIESNMQESKTLACQSPDPDSDDIEELNASSDESLSIDGTSGVSTSPSESAVTARTTSPPETSISIRHESPVRGIIDNDSSSFSRTVTPLQECSASSRNVVKKSPPAELTELQWSSESAEQMLPFGVPETDHELDSELDVLYTETCGLFRILDHNLQLLEKDNHADLTPCEEDIGKKLAGLGAEAAIKIDKFTGALKSVSQLPLSAAGSRAIVEQLNESLNIGLDAKLEGVMEKRIMPLRSSQLRAKLRQALQRVDKQLRDAEADILLTRAQQTAPPLPDLTIAIDAVSVRISECRRRVQRCLNELRPYHAARAYSNIHRDQSTPSLVDAQLFRDRVKARQLTTALVERLSSRQTL